MIDPGFEKVIAKASKLQELKRARARVRQLERELRGEPVKPEEPFKIPAFLAQPLPSPRPAARPNLSVIELDRSAA